MRILGAAILAFAVVTPAIGEAVTVRSAEPFVALRDDAGNEVLRRADTFPLVPLHVCYGWRIRLSGAGKLVKATEVFELPAPPQEWKGVEGDQFSPTTLSPNRQTSTTSKFYTPQDGWITNQWCVAPGDPAGRYVIKVYIGDLLLKEFDFTAQTARAQ